MNHVGNAGGLVLMELLEVPEYGGEVSRVPVVVPACRLGIDHRIDGITGECVFADRSYRSGNANVGQVVATVECICVDDGDALGNGDALQIITAVECIRTDDGDAFGDGDILQTVTVVECVLADLGQRGGQRHLLEVVAVIECVCRDLDHALSQGDLGQIAVASEYVCDDGLVAVHAGDDDLLCLAVVSAHVSVAAVGENVGDTVFVCVNVLVIPDDRCRTPVFMPACGLGCAGDGDGTVSKGVLADGGDRVGNDQILDRSAFKRALADLLKGCGQGQLL